MKLKKEDGKLKVWSDYCSEFVRQAKMIQGKWDGSSSCWTFPEENESEVKALLLDIYGENGEPQETVDILVDISDMDGSEITLCNRQIARRFSRDSSVVLADNVMLVSGGFASSGGSRNNPAVSPKEGTIVKIKKVPIGYYEKVKDMPEVSLVSAAAQSAKAEPEYNLSEQEAGKSYISAAKCKFAVCDVAQTSAVIIETPLTSESVPISSIGNEIDPQSIPEYVSCRKFTVMDGEKTMLAICDLPLTDARIRQIRSFIYTNYPNPMKYNVSLSGYMSDIGNLAHPVIRAMVAAFDDYEHERLTNQPTPYPSIRYIDREGDNEWKWRDGVPLDARKEVVKKALAFFAFADTDDAILRYDTIYYEHITNNGLGSGDSIIPTLYKRIRDEYEELI